MFKVFYGPNRLEAEKAIKQTLGDSYEVFEGEKLELADLPSIFRGTSLFGEEKRRILLKDLGENPAVWEKVIDYLDTSHEVIIWEMKLDKRSSGYKGLKDAGADLVEFAETKKPDFNLVFNILNTAFRDGVQAVKMLEQIESEQDPYMFFGLLVTQMLKKYEASGAAARERRILKELATLDIQMKSSSIEPWNLVKSFLLRVKEM